MFQDKKYIFIFIGIIVVIGVLITIYFYEKSNPQNVIENTFKIILPSDSKIIKYNYDNNGGYLDTKISIESKSYNDVKEQLNNFFKEPYKGKISDAPNFINTCQWWDLDKSNIDTCYFTFVSSKKKLFLSLPKTHEVWAFITKEKNGEHYLYISY